MSTKKTQPKTTTSNAPATTVEREKFAVGQLVEHTYEDIPTATTTTTVGIVTKVTKDGAYVAPLSSAAVVPVDQLRAR